MPEFSGPRPERRLSVVLYGFGKVGQASLRLALTRPWIRVSGLIAGSSTIDGTYAQTLVPEAPGELRISTDARRTLREARPDVVLVATKSRLPDVLPHLREAAAVGADVVCSAEELAYIDSLDGPAAQEIAEVAARNAIAIVAAGVNPGFVLDYWPLVLAGLAWDVRHVEARRVTDVGGFGPTVHRMLGIDRTISEFEAGLAEGTIAGHLGFRESLRSIGSSLGMHLDEITIRTDPIVAEQATRLEYSTVNPGRTVGARQEAIGIVRGEPWIRIQLTLHVDPQGAGLAPVDEIHIDGIHPLHVVMTPGCAAVPSTAAQLVNSIPLALKAPPGVYGRWHFPPSPPWLGGSVPD